LKGKLVFRRWLFSKQQEVYVDDPAADILLAEEVWITDSLAYLASASQA